MAGKSKLSVKDIAITSAVLDNGWHFAVLTSLPDNEKLRGMIIGDAGYIQYVTSNLAEEYTIIINHNSPEYKLMKNG